MNEDDTILGSLWPDVYADLARWIVEMEQEAEAENAE